MNIHIRSKPGFEISVNCHENLYPGSKFTIQILEKLQGNAFRNGIVDSQIPEYRLQCAG